LTGYLNNAIQQAARTAGADYVDISQALVGHRLCEAASYDVAVNGLTSGSDAGLFGINVFGHESYHPNAFGQLLIEQAILRQTNNFAAVNLAPASTAPLVILNAPKTGRPINTVVPDDNLTPANVLSNQPISLRLDGLQDGLKPSAAYTIRLDGVSGQVLQTVTTDSAGSATTEVELPKGTSPGTHTIDITGQNQADEPVDVTPPIYLPRDDGHIDLTDQTFTSTLAGTIASAPNPPTTAGDITKPRARQDQGRTTIKPIQHPVKLKVAAASARPKLPLYIIDWLPWLGWLAWLWLVVLLGMGVKRF